MRDRPGPRGRGFGRRRRRGRLRFSAGRRRIRPRPARRTAVVRREVEAAHDGAHVRRAPASIRRSTTGLLLTVALAARRRRCGRGRRPVLDGACARRLARASIAASRHGARRHATDFSTSVLRAITQLGSTVVVIVVAAAVAPVAAPPTLRPHRCSCSSCSWSPVRTCSPNLVKVLVARARARHRSARRVLGCLVPERAFRGGRGDLRRVRAARRARRVPAASAAVLARRAPSDRGGGGAPRACCSACTGSPMCWPARAGLGLVRALLDRVRRPPAALRCTGRDRRASRRQPVIPTPVDASEPSALPTARTLETTSLSYTTRTFWASSPLRPGATSNSTA